MILTANYDGYCSLRVQHRWAMFIMARFVVKTCTKQLETLCLFFRVIINNNFIITHRVGYLTLTSTRDEINRMIPFVAKLFN